MNDLIGQRFGRLVVIKLAGKDKWGAFLWSCRCNCKDKNEIIVRGSSIKDGNTKSCGCLQKESVANHGHSHDRTYVSWNSMKQRCINPNHIYYKNYGGRGIMVCVKWLEFSNFLQDMGERPKGCSVERRNNVKGYYPDNCYWGTNKQQQRNTRRNHLITHNGKTKCISAWAEEYKINYRTLLSRINKSCWSIENALMTPVQKRKASNDEI